MVPEEISVRAESGGTAWEGDGNGVTARRQVTTAPGTNTRFPNFGQQMATGLTVTPLVRTCRISLYQPPLPRASRERPLSHTAFPLLPFCP